MPFQSEKQRRFLHANHPEIAKRWEKEYANGGISNHFRRKLAEGSWHPGVGRDEQGYQSNHPSYSGGNGGGDGGGGGDGPKPHSGPTAAELAAAKAAAAAAAQKKAMEEAQLQAKEMAIQRQHKKKKVDYSKKLQAFGVNEYENLIKPGVVDYQKKHLPDYDVEGFDLQMENLADHARFLKFKKKSGVGVPKDYVVDPYSQTLGEMLLGEAHTIPIGLNIEQTDYLDKVAKKGVVKESGQFFTYDSPDDVKKQLKKLDEKSEEWIGTDINPKKIVSGDKKTYATDKDVKEYLQKKGIELKDDMGRKLEIGLAHGGILDIDASEEIISDDGNDIELTDYNAAFDDPNDLSTGVKTLFQAKDGGRIGYAQGWSPGVAAEERAAEKSSGGGQYHGGGADVMAVSTPTSSPSTGSGRTRIQEETQEDFRQKEMAKTLAIGPGSMEEKYDTDEQREAEVYGLRKWQEKEKRVTKLTADFIKKNLKRLNADKYYKEKYGDELWGKLQKGWEVYKSIPKPTLISILTEMYKEHKLTSEGEALLNEWGDLIGGPPGTNPQAYDDLYYALEKRKAKYRYDDDTGDDGPEPIYAPLTGAVSEEYAQGDYDFDSRANWNAMKQKQALNAALQEKWAAEKEAHEQLYMVANSGGLANLFRVKNQ